MFWGKIFLGNNSHIILITARKHHAPNSDGQEAAQQRKILFFDQRVERWELSFWSTHLCPRERLRLLCRVLLGEGGVAMGRSSRAAPLRIKFWVQRLCAQPPCGHLKSWTEVLLAVRLCTATELRCCSGLTLRTLVWSAGYETAAHVPCEQEKLD